MSPERIQRQRTRGWKKPENTICVTRGTFWGNPFVVRPDLEPGTKVGHQYIAVANAEDAVLTYREFLDQNPDLKTKARHHLRGKNLACWCAPGEQCHGDVLLEIANPKGSQRT